MMENSLDQIKHIFSESNKNKVAIVGKGTSLEQINLVELEKDYFVIALNDVDLPFAADITVFYKPQLVQTFVEGGFSSRYYLAPKSLELPSGKHIPAEYVSLDQEGLERVYSYFYTPDFYILDFTLLSAIKLSMLFQKVKDNLLETVFLGFDFFIDSVNKGDVLGLEYRNAHLKTQESIFITLRKDLEFKNPDLRFSHVGNKKYSKFTIDQFNASLEHNLLSKDLPTNSVIYGKLLEKLNSSNHVIVVAEFTNNHIGDRNRLLKMIELAVEAGADMIKVQKRDVNTFYTEEELASPYSSPFGETLADYRFGVELTDDMFELLDVECRKRNIPWFASVLDWNSYLHMEKLDCPMVKLPSTISNHRNYLKKVAQHFKGELVVSTGFTEQSYEDFVLDNLVNDRKLFLLQCTSSYPTPPEGCQISVVRHYEQLREKHANIVPGYSSHDLGSIGCMMAVAAGARMVEKHVKLGDLDWVHFDSVALDLYNDQFKNFVADIRKAEIMCGNKEKVVHSFEHHKYKANDNVN
ncbi:N-acetylneuraminate synthase family protein [Sphingobacterium corticibacter]|uniref:N-acetylneuraminate synthase n=1 Tax=Sphingobacterium corticibacter TaxID=2171749 RepID=A0A2T8HJX1_9SPHI|nr:N-acetylneuraminate synthase family protein [Sphingobacterium corticibacter]PVH25612.1 N-acetylneuraminate synthase [Sphingobacterium corticibacter]